MRFLSLTDDVQSLLGCSILNFSKVVFFYRFNGWNHAIPLNALLSCIQLFGKLSLSGHRAVPGIAMRKLVRYASLFSLFYGLLKLAFMSLYICQSFILCLDRCKIRYGAISPFDITLHATYAPTRPWRRRKLPRFLLTVRLHLLLQNNWMKIMSCCPFALPNTVLLIVSWEPLEQSMPNWNKFSTADFQKE